MTGVQSGSLSGVQYGTPRAYTPCAGVPKQGKDALFICFDHGHNTGEIVLVPAEGSWRRDRLKRGTRP